jgi:alpha-L-fucosidase 2
MGAAWLCLHILEHYRYSGDRDFMEEHLPVIKEAALFFEDTLIENENGQLVVSPTVSPENTYVFENGERGMMCEGASMDAQILYELFSGLIETEMISDEEKGRYTAILNKLPKPQIAATGTICEWAKEYEEVEIGHRHISHLFALYPGKQLFDRKIKKNC